MAVFFSLFGIGLDLVGALFLVGGDLREGGGWIRYWTQTGSEIEREQTRKRLRNQPFWRRLPLVLAEVFGPRDYIAAMDQRPVAVWLPARFWGATFLVLGFAGQGLGVLLN